jgi:phosphoribosylanthranilate isomerase
MAFLIKICGVTNTEDASAATEAGADAIGFNFFNQSRRFVEPLQARDIGQQLPARVWKVGVFVNDDANQIASIVEQADLTAVQLHGDEPAAIVADLPIHVRIVRAYRCGSDGLSPLAYYLDECHARGRMPDALLIDADAGAAFGGSGQLADWEVIRKQRESLGGLPLILAGGLNANNIAAAIQATAPDGVDVASGVEREPGRKDAALVASFIAAARKAAPH